MRREIRAKDVVPCNWMRKAQCVSRGMRIWVVTNRVRLRAFVLFAVWSVHSIGLSQNTVVFPPIIVTPTNIVVPPTNNFPPPTNDAFANPLALQGDSGIVTGSLAGATAETGEPDHDSTTAKRTVWFAWTAPADGTAEVLDLSNRLWTVVTWPDTHTTARLRSMGVYRGQSLSNLIAVPLLPNEPPHASPDTPLRLANRFPAQAGVTYRIALNGSDNLGFQTTQNYALSFVLSRFKVITSPAHASPTIGETVSVEYFADVASNSLQSVEAFAGTNSLGLLAAEPFRFGYAATNVGSLMISARATNRTGESLPVLTTWFVVRPTNDFFASATEIPGGAGSMEVTQNCRYASIEPGEAKALAALNPRHTLWWRWRPAFGGEVTVTRYSAGALTVLRGDSLGSLEPVQSLTGTDYSGGYGGTPYTSRSFRPVAGQTYYFVADSEEMMNWRFDQRLLTLVPGPSAQRGNVQRPVSLAAIWSGTNLPPLVEYAVEEISGTRAVIDRQVLTATMPPDFAVTWTPTRAGKFSVRASATNSAGVHTESSRTAFTIHAFNDDFAQASIIPASTRTTNQSFLIRGASVEDFEPVPLGGSGVPSLWWKWKPNYSGFVAVRARHGLRDLPVEVFIGDSVRKLRRIAATPGGGFGASSYAKLRLRNRTTCYIRVSIPESESSATQSLESADLIIEQIRSLHAPEVEFSFFGPIRRGVLPVNARALLPDQLPVVGEAFLAQLYVGKTARDLKPVGPAQPFFDPSDVGHWLDGAIQPTTILLPDVTQWQQHVARVKVWEARFGSTFETARGNGYSGQSDLLTLTPGKSCDGLFRLHGLRDFSLKLADVSPGAQWAAVSAKSTSGAELSLVLRNGRIVGSLTGSVGRSYAVEAQAPGQAWETILVLTNISGSVEFTDPRSNNPPACLYRARLLQ